MCNVPCSSVTETEKQILRYSYRNSIKTNRLLAAIEYCTTIIPRDFQQIFIQKATHTLEFGGQGRKLAAYQPLLPDTLSWDKASGIQWICKKTTPKKM